MSNVFPARNLPVPATAWAREIENRVVSGERSETALTQKVDNGLRATGGQLSAMSAQLDSIITQQAEMSAVLARLSNAGEVVEASSGTGSSGTGWYANPPSVSAISLSGKFEVSVFGTSAGAMSFYSFSATGFLRSRIQGDSQTARLSRVSGAGGASTAMTVYGSWVVAAGTPGTSVEFTAQALGTTSYSETVALKIQVRPVL